jgi:hypothetical protein
MPDLPKPFNMSAHSYLLGLYQEWRSWSEMEGAAIQSAAWNRVDECQGAKLQLQPRIVAASETLHTELAAARQPYSAYEPQLRGIVAELIALERRNSEWLAEQRKHAQAEADSLSRTGGHLRQVRRAYAPSRESAWHSYS